MPRDETAPATSVLIVDDDAFGGSYVAQVLIGRGIAVIGPVCDVSKVRDAVRAGALHAAVIAQASHSADRAAICSELDRAGIPYLTLLRTAPRCPAIDTPSLTAPFAGHQVADWIENAVRP